MCTVLVIDKILLLCKKRLLNVRTIGKFQLFKATFGKIVCKMFLLINYLFICGMKVIFLELVNRYDFICKSPVLQQIM